MLAVKLDAWLLHFLPLITVTQDNKSTVNEIECLLTQALSLLLNVALTKYDLDSVLLWKLWVYRSECAQQAVPSVNPKIKRWSVCRRLCFWRCGTVQWRAEVSWTAQLHSAAQRHHWAPTVKSCGHSTGAFHGRSAHPNSLLYYPEFLLCVLPVSLAMNSTMWLKVPI